MTGPGVGTGEGGAPAGGVTATLFTQDQVNHFAAEAKRSATSTFFKDLGFDKVPTADELKGAFQKAGEFDKRVHGQKGDVERLTTELADANKKAERVSTLETDLDRARIAADAGLKSRYWKYIEGDNEADITASVKAILADVGGAGEGAGDDDKGGDDGKGGGPDDTSSGGKAPNPQQGRGGGGPAKPTMQSGRDAYQSRHKKE